MQEAGQAGESAGVLSTEHGDALFQPKPRAMSRPLGPEVACKLRLQRTYVAAASNATFQSGAAKGHMHQQHAGSQRQPPPVPRSTLLPV